LIGDRSFGGEVLVHVHSSMTSIRFED